MFTLDQIKEAHSKVKSGAEFPAYIRDLKKMGVTSYEAFVADGHTVYYGADDFILTSPAKYDELDIADNSDPETFKSDLKAHQEGKTGYPVFCGDAAKSGVEKWTVSMEEMSCTYYDKAGNVVIEEKIPG